MLIHNKRLHPRRPGEHGDHYNNCSLHENDRQRSVSPSRCYTPSHYSSMCSLSQSRHRTRESSVSGSLSPAASSLSPPISFDFKYSVPTSSTPKRYSTASILSNSSAVSGKTLRAPEKLSSRARSKSTNCLNGGQRDKRNGTVTFKMYDSPDVIIENLFPGINEKETTYLRKGHGAAQVAKQRGQLGDTYRSASALANYGTEVQPPRTCSTSSENSAVPIPKERNYQRVTVNAGRLASVERDFGNLRYRKGRMRCTRKQIHFAKRIHLSRKINLNSLNGLCLFMSPQFQSIEQHVDDVELGNAKSVSDQRKRRQQFTESTQQQQRQPYRNER